MMKEFLLKKHTIVVAFILGLLFSCSQPKPKVACENMPIDSSAKSLDTTKIDTCKNK